MLPGRAYRVGVEIAAQFRHRIGDPRAQIGRFKPQPAGERAGNRGGSDDTLEAELPVTESDHEQRGNKERCAARRDEGDIGEEKRGEH
jgi:hypothetical protein